MKQGLYENIHRKRERIAKGSGEKMRRVGSEGAPTSKAFKQSARTAKMSAGGAPNYFHPLEDKLRARTYMNAQHRMPREGQTDRREIYAINDPTAKRVAYDTDARREETMREKADRPNQLKKFINLSLGEHRKSNVPKKSGGAVKKSNSCW